MRGIFGRWTFSDATASAAIFRVPYPDIGAAGRKGRSDRVVVNDLDPETVAAIRSRTRSHVVGTTHHDNHTLGFRARMAKAEAYYISMPARNVA